MNNLSARPSRSRKWRLLGMAGLAFASTACIKATSEQLPVSLYEAKAPAGALSGRIAYVRQTAVDRSAIGIYDGATATTWTLQTPPGWVEDLSFSPDGSRLAYAYGPTSANTHLWLVSRSGGDARALTTGADSEADPAWSPDGHRLAAAVLVGGDWKLETVDASSGATQVLSVSGAQARYPTWLPDGHTLVYSARDSVGHFKLWSYDLTSGSSRRLTSGSSDDLFPKAGPANGSVVFSSTRELGSQTFILSPRGYVSAVQPSNSVERWPAWSPDAKRIVISVPHLGVYNANGSRLPANLLRWQLTKAPAWSASWTRG